MTRRWGQAAIISNQNKADAMLEIVEVPMAPQLFRMPGSGYSGRSGSTAQLKLVALTGG